MIWLIYTDKKMNICHYKLEWLNSLNINPNVLDDGFQRTAFLLPIHFNISNIMLNFRDNLSCKDPTITLE
jgi:hypothetical protein